jgi:signal transduction histidine kinase
MLSSQHRRLDEAHEPPPPRGELATKAVSAPTPAPIGSSPAKRKLSIRGLRRLILIVLALSTVAFTSGVYLLVHRVFQNFGPGVEQDLVWKTVRGAQDLARAADVGLVVEDAQLVAASFGDYRGSDDMLGIAAVAGAEGRLVASIGQLPEPLDQLFSGPPGVARRTPGYLVSWAPAVIEGRPVGQVAMVVKTRRLVESQALLRRLSLGTFALGIATLALGVLFVNFFTRSIVDRDAQLAGYAAGLEGKVALRTAELDRANEGMRLVLDNVQQGFITVSLNEVMASERSTVVDRWFGPPPADGTFSGLIRPFGEDTAAWFSLGCEALREGVMPVAMVLDQFPKRISVGDRVLQLSYIGIGAAESPDRLLVVLSDVTDELARERIERDAREMTRTFQRITADRAGFEQFFAEAGDIVKQILTGTADLVVEKRLIHTLKGNCRVFGVDSVADACHGLETQLEGEERGTTELERAGLGAAWDRFARLVLGLLGDGHRQIIELGEEEYERLLGALRAGTASAELIAIVERWRLEPVSQRLARLADRARYAAERLNKTPLTVHLEAGTLRLDANEWAPFWTALVHAVNNAIDHGLESAEKREAAGKPPGGTLWLSAAEAGGSVVVSLRDDGGGIDWCRLREKGRAAGLPHASRSELVEVMFMDGVTTNDAVTSTSGRGVGMGALRAATEALGGQIEVDSEPNQGTTFRFVFPRPTKGRIHADAPATSVVQAA